jgi:branched-chain amino acid transport system permease protein
MGPQIAQFLASGISLGSIYALVAVGFTIIYSATGVINFAQGEFVMLGGLFAATLAGSAHLPLPLACLISVAAVTAIGILFERAVVHPLRGTSVLTMTIATIAGSILLKGIAMFVWGKETYFLPAFSGETPISFLGAAILPQSLWIVGITAMVVAVLSVFFRRAILGKAMRAVAANPAAARLVGIRVGSIILLSFALSAAIGAVGGVIITPVALVDYDRGSLLALKGFAAAVLGGIGSFPGAVAAGLILGVLESLGAGLLSSHYKDAIALVILLAMLFLRPAGILGSKEASKLKEY